MADQPLFSVIIPTCHRNEALALCLERLAPGAQTLPFEQYEVIVTDDGRETTAEAMVRERFSWATWTQGPRRGPAANRNHGASLACGEWLAFTDDDCLPDTGWLTALTEAAESSVLAVEGAVRPLGNAQVDMAECPVNTTGGLFWSANVAVRKDLFEAIGGFEERFRIAAHEDEDLYLRIRHHASVQFQPGAIVYHPVRVARLCDTVKRVPVNASTTALYYALNAQRLGVRRFTTLLRWLYKPRLVAAFRNLAHGRPKAALVEMVWVVYGNILVLREWASYSRTSSSECNSHVP